MSLHLTFDDGPSEWTSAILDLLAEYQARATFFVIGAHLEGREGIVRRAGYDGHTVGNHTWTHPRLTGATDSEIRAELGDTSRHVEYIVGKTPAVWRAPFFGRDERVDAIASDFGLAHVGADIVPEDCFTNDALIIAERVIEAARNRDDSPVVCLHDGIPPDGGSSSCTKSRQPTVDAVRLILEALA